MAVVSILRYLLTYSPPLLWFPVPNRQAPAETSSINTLPCTHVTECELVSVDHKISPPISHHSVPWIGASHVSSTSICSLSFPLLLIICVVLGIYFRCDCQILRFLPQVGLCCGQFKSSQPPWVSDLGVSCFSLIQESLVSLRFLGFVYIMAGRLLAVSVVSQVLNSTNISLQKHMLRWFFTVHLCFKS